MERAVGRALLRLTGMLLTAVALIALVAPRAVNTDYRAHVVIPTCLALCAFAVAGRLPDVVQRSPSAAVVALLGGGVAAAVGSALRYPYGWDAGAVMTIAQALDVGRPLTSAELSYLSTFPNNLPLLAVDRAVVWVSGQLGVAPDAVVVALNAVCVAISLYAAGRAVAPAAGRGRAVAAQLVLVALVGLSPWLAVPYTDVLAMPLVTGGVALGCAALRATSRRRRFGCGAACLALLVAAFVVKTTPVVAVVAVTLVAGLWAVGRPQPLWRKAAGALGSLVLTLALVTTGAAALTELSRVASGVDSSRLQPDAAPPVLWWLANGANATVTPTGMVTYGSYDRAMVLATRDRSQTEVNDYARAHLRDRWSERGPSGTLAFYGNKLAWNWGDGMFWSWGEGFDARPGVLGPADGFVGFVHDIDGKHGRWYPLRSDLTQGLWLALLLVAGVGCLRAPFGRDVLAVALTVLGVAAFTLLFQGRSRYLFAFVPVVAALAGLVHPHVPRLSRSGSEARRRRPPAPSHRRSG